MAIEVRPLVRRSDPSYSQAPMARHATVLRTSNPTPLKPCASRVTSAFLPRGQPESRRTAFGGVARWHRYVPEGINAAISHSPSGAQLRSIASLTTPDHAATGQ